MGACTAASTRTGRPVIGAASASASSASTTPGGSVRVAAEASADCRDILRHVALEKQLQFVRILALHQPFHHLRMILRPSGEGIRQGEALASPEIGVAEK